MSTHSRAQPPAAPSAALSLTLAQHSTCALRGPPRASPLLLHSFSWSPVVSLPVFTHTHRETGQFCFCVLELFGFKSLLRSLGEKLSETSVPILRIFNMVQGHDSVGKDFCCQACGDSQCGRRDPAGCPLTSASALWHTDTHAHTDIQITFLKK